MKFYIIHSGNCAVCGKSSECPPVAPTHQEDETFDLDLRTGEPTRSLINTWVMCCPHCGYCALSIYLASTPAIKEMVASEEYAKQLHNPGFPDVANRFLCSALAISTLPDPAIAGWESLRAAWVCDDAGLAAGARECRLKAYNFFEESLIKTPKLAGMWNVSDLLLCDLLRRTEQFDKVRHIAEIDLKRPWPEQIESVFRYQVMLARNRDTACHTIAEALNRASDLGALRN